TRSTIAAVLVRRFLGLSGSQLPQSPMMRGTPGDEPQPSIVKRSVSPTAQAPCLAGRGAFENRRKKFSVVICVICSVLTLIVSARAFAVLTTYAGSLRLPRMGTGAR